MERTEFARHLGVCPSWVAYLSSNEKTVLLTRRSAEEAVPWEVPEALAQAILAARTRG